MFDFKMNLPKELAEKINRLLDTYQATLQNQLTPNTTRSLFQTMQRMVGSAVSKPLTEEEKKQEEKDTEMMKKFLAGMEPEILEQTQLMVKEQIQELLLMGGNRRRILELLKLGKIPKLIRKKEARGDPLYLQFGDGVKEPIEEIYIIG